MRIGSLQSAVVASLVTLLCCRAPTAVLAAEPTGPQPGQDRPLPEIAPTPDLDFTIQAPRRSPVPRAVEELSFDVKDIRVSGATLYSASVLDGYTRPVIGKTVPLAALISIAEQIEARYHGDGYILTRVFVPTQSVSDGVFQISVVEGFIAAVAVRGGDADTRQRVERLLVPITQSRPLKLAVLESALLTANQLPGVTAAGLLRPSPTEPAASELVVSVSEAPLGASLSVDNFGGASTGRWTVAGESSFHSPLGDGGQMTLDGSVDPADINRRNSLSGRYVAPLPLTDDVTYTLSGLSSHGQPGGTVSNLKLITDSTAFGARLGLPLLVSRDDKLTIDGGFTVQSANVGALGSPLTHDEWRVLDVALAFQDNSFADGISNATLSIAQGVPSLGATASGSAGLSRPGGRTDFTKLAGIFRRTQSIAGPLSALVSISGQYGFDTLLTGEEVSFGGGGIGRGYDPGSVTGDSGVGGSAELRYDLDAADVDLDQLQLYSFFDAGKVWAHNGTIVHDEIASAGGGVRTVIMGDVTLGLLYAKAMIAVPGNAEGKLSQRVMVNTSVRF